MEPTLRSACEGVGVGHWRGLGQAIALDQTAAGEFLKSLLHLDGQRRRAADAGLDGRQPVGAHVRGLVDGHVHRGHAGKDGRLVTV